MFSRHKDKTIRPAVVTVEVKQYTDDAARMVIISFAEDHHVTTITFSEDQYREFVRKTACVSDFLDNCKT